MLKVSLKLAERPCGNSLFQGLELTFFFLYLWVCSVKIISINRSEGFSHLICMISCCWLKSKTWARPPPNIFTQVGLVESWWSGGYFHVAERKSGSSSDAIMDWVIRCTGTPEEKMKINFHVEGRCNSGSYITIHTHMNMMATLNIQGCLSPLWGVLSKDNFAVSTFPGISKSSGLNNILDIAILQVCKQSNVMGSHIVLQQFRMVTTQERASFSLAALCGLPALISHNHLQPHKREWMAKAPYSISPIQSVATSLLIQLWSHCAQGILPEISLCYFILKAWNHKGLRLLNQCW